MKKLRDEVRDSEEAVESPEEAARRVVEGLLKRMNLWLEESRLRLLDVFRSQSFNSTDDDDSSSKERGADEDDFDEGEIL